MLEGMERRQNKLQHILVDLMVASTLKKMITKVFLNA